MKNPPKRLTFQEEKEIRVAFQQLFNVSVKNGSVHDIPAEKNGATFISQ